MRRRPQKLLPISWRDASWLVRAGKRNVNSETVSCLLRANTLRSVFGTDLKVALLSVGRDLTASCITLMLASETLALIVFDAIRIRSVVAVRQSSRPLPETLSGFRRVLPAVH